MGRNPLTPGHPGVRVRNVLGKSGPKKGMFMLFPNSPVVIIKMPQVANSLRVVSLLSDCDVPSRRTLCRHHFPGNYRHFSSQRRVRGVENMGDVVKTLPHSNSSFCHRRSSFSTKGPLVFSSLRRGSIAFYLGVFPDLLFFQENPQSEIIKYAPN